VRAQVRNHYGVLTRGTGENAGDSGAGDAPVHDDWTAKLDAELRGLVEEHGRRWSVVAAHLSAARTGNACRKRYDRLEDPGKLKRHAEATAAARASKKPRRGGEPDG
jgi:hypothetical protein